jgi:hypothetical protein
MTETCNANDEANKRRSGNALSKKTTPEDGHMTMTETGNANDEANKRRSGNALSTKDDH